SSGPRPGTVQGTAVCARSVMRSPGRGRVTRGPLPWRCGSFTLITPGQRPFLRSFPPDARGVRPRSSTGVSPVVPAQPPPYDGCTGPPPARSAADGRRPMVQILTLRERLAAVPGTVRRRAGGAGERLVAASAARAIAPETPRTAGPHPLERAASRRLRRAAPDEVARGGVTRLPPR